MDRFPGYYEPNAGIPQRPDNEQLIRELYNWIDTPELFNTNAGQGLARYLRSRNVALASAAQLGISEGGFRSAKATRAHRYWLQQQGRYLATMYPEFGPLFDQILLREVEFETDVDEDAELLSA